MLDMDPETPAASAERHLKPALLDGWKGKCPNCQQGRIFRGYLSVSPECPVCGEELHHHRADDGPAYITIIVASHLLAPFIHITFVQLRPDPLVLGVVFSLIFVAMALYLLPRIKGAFINLQWARRLHGFAAASTKRNRLP